LHSGQIDEQPGNWWLITAEWRGLGRWPIGQLDVSAEDATADRWDLKACNKDLPGLDDGSPQNVFFEALADALKAACSKQAKAKRKTGAPGIDAAQRIERLALAQEGTEIHKPGTTYWKEIRQQVGWHFGGSNESARKLFENARDELERLAKDDPEHVLIQVAKYRKERKIIT
jgi:hypothetical protein